MSSEEVRLTFGERVDRAIAGERTFVTRWGKPAAVLLGMRDFESLTSPK